MPQLPQTPTAPPRSPSRHPELSRRSSWVSALTLSLMATLLTGNYLSHRPGREQPTILSDLSDSFGLGSKTQEPQRTVRTLKPGCSLTISPYHLSLAIACISTLTLPARSLRPVTVTFTLQSDAANSSIFEEPPKATRSWRVRSSPSDRRPRTQIATRTPIAQNSFEDGLRTVFADLASGTTPSSEAIALNQSIEFAEDVESAGQPERQVPLSRRFHSSNSRRRWNRAAIQCNRGSYTVRGRSARRRFIAENQRHAAVVFVCKYGHVT